MAQPPELRRTAQGIEFSASGGSVLVLRKVDMRKLEEVLMREGVQKFADYYG